jgi:hypothetical protein
MSVPPGTIVVTAKAPPTAPSRLATAFREAILAGLVTLGLCIPIVAWRAEPDLQNNLVLTTRFGLVAYVVASIVGARFLAALLDDWRARAVAVAGFFIAMWGTSFLHGIPILPLDGFARLGMGVALIAVAFALDTWLASRKPPAGSRFS